MGSTTLSRRIVESLPWLDEIAEAVQPKVQNAVAAGGRTVRDVLDGKYLEASLHPICKARGLPGKRTAGF